MSLNNPYCTIAELKAELKFPAADTSRDTELGDAINAASRFVDNYLGRDFFSRPALVTPLVVDEFDLFLLDDVIYLPYHVHFLDAVFLGETRLEEGTDFIVKRPEDSGARNIGPTRIIRLGASWGPLRPDNTVSLYGFFGYPQSAVYPVSAVGVANFCIYQAFPYTTLYGLLGEGGPLTYGARYPWSVADFGGTDWVFSIFEENGALMWEEFVPVGAGPASFLAVRAGVNWVRGGRVLDQALVYAPATRYLARAEAAVTRTVVPTGLPDVINKAARIIAAAYSGHNRKETVGLDGNKTSIIDTEVPKTAWELLGPRPRLLC